MAQRPVTTSPKWRLGLGLVLVVATALVGLAPPQNAHAQSVTAMIVGSGLVLADPDGWTLYTWDGDSPGVSNCYDACAAAWLPYTLDTDPVGPSSLGLIERLDGTWQVTYEDWPLYYFIRDLQPGDTNGDGSMGFDARWYVVDLGPAPAAVMPPAPEAPFTPPPMPQAPPMTSPAPPIVSQQPPAPMAANVSVRIADFDFRPASVSVQIGDTVTWTNDGPAPHTATSDRGLWDTRELRRGQSGSQTFASAGTFNYHCAIHPQMRGVVIVGGGGTSAQPQIPGFPPDLGTGYGPYQPGSPYAPGPGIPFPIGSPGYAVGGQTATVSVVAPPNGTVFLNWLPSVGAQSYRIYETLSSQPLNFQVVQTVSQSLGVLATNASVSGLAPGQTYLFQVRAVGANGMEIVAPSSASASPGPYVPGALITPTGLTVAASGLNGVTLSWAETPGAMTYQVLQGSAAAGPFTVVGSTALSTETATVSGLTTGTTYFFQVKAVDAAGNVSPPSATVSATIGASLAAPTGLTVVGTTATSASLSWTAAPSAISYQVLQATTAAGPFVLVGTSTVTTAAVSGLAPSTQYFFQVKAIDGSGATSAASTTVSATTVSGLAGVL